MNTERLRAVRHTIAANPSEYDQEQYLHDCGTPACIAGWAAHLSLTDGERLSQVNQSYGSCILDRHGAMVTNVSARAGGWLGLSSWEQVLMFAGHPIEYRDAGATLHCRPSTVDEALAMLDHAIETGEVRWEPLS